MSNQVLLRFLNVGLLNLNGDDAKLAKLQEAAGDLAATLQKKPDKTLSFALIACDPEAPADDPVIGEAAAVLQKRWATYVNTFSGTPVTVIRAILLEALVQAAADETVGLAFVASARNALPFMEAAHEEAIWVDVVAEIEKRVDARAELEWATPESIQAPTMHYEKPSSIELPLVSASINNEELVMQLQAAAGPNSISGATGGNPYQTFQQNTQHNQNWVTEFGQRAAAAISTALEAALEEPEAGSIDLSEPLLQLSQAVSNYVGDTLKVVSAATSGLQRRTNLIWWKESLYSLSARASYRTLPAPTAAALMAFDMYQQVPVFSPASVAAFLHETVLSLPSVKADEKHSIRDLLIASADASALSELREVAGQLIPENSGRGPVLGLLGTSNAQVELDDETFRLKTGIPAATMLSLPEWAIWLLRELQAAQATLSAAKPKRRGSKPK